MRDLLTQYELKNILEYSQDSGVFLWRKRLSDRIKLGQIAGSFKYSKGRPLRIIIRINKVDYQAHHLAWLYVYGCLPKQSIDHIDGNPFNNSILNLRLCNAALNNQNRHSSQSNSKSKVLGVSWHKKAKKWVSYVRKNYKTTYLGLFESQEEARLAYLKAKRELHEFCTI